MISCLGWTRNGERAAASITLRGARSFSSIVVRLRFFAFHAWYTFKRRWNSWRQAYWTFQSKIMVIITYGVQNQTKLYYSNQTDTKTPRKYHKLHWHFCVRLFRSFSILFGVLSASVRFNRCFGTATASSIPTITSSNSISQEVFIASRSSEYFHFDRSYFCRPFSCCWARAFSDLKVQPRYCY